MATEIPQATREAIRKAHADLRSAVERARAVTRRDGTDGGGHPGIMAANLEGYLGRYPIPLLNALEESESQVAELEARVATLTEERDAARSECGVRRRLSITLCDRAEAAEREAATLRSVLAPFAALADTVDDLHHEDDSTCPHRLKAGDIRRARAALAGAGRSTEGEG